MTPLRILFLAPDVPPTPRAPGSSRLYDLMRGLHARGHSLALVCGVADAARWEQFLYEDGGAQLLTQAYPIFAVPQLSFPGRVRNLLSSRPAFDTRHRAPAYDALLRTTVARALEEFPCDVLHVDRLVMAQYVPAPRKWAYVVDPHDAISLTEARKLALKRLNPAQRLLQRYQAAKIKRYEQAVAQKADAYVVNAEPDRAYLATFLPRAKLHCIPNGVDTEFYHPAPDRPTKQQLVFTGTFTYIYNTDAILYFHANILPRLRASLPDLQLMIVGAEPPPAVQQLARDPLTRVTGYVTDVRPYLWESAVVISPLRNGTGMKNKLLIAMALGKAIVATPSSAEGLGVRDGEQMLLAESDTAFTDAVTRVLNDAQLAHRLGQAGRAFVEREYDYTKLAARFEELYRKILPRDF